MLDSKHLHRTSIEKSSWMNDASCIKRLECSVRAEERNIGTSPIQHSEQLPISSYIMIFFG